MKQLVQKFTRLTFLMCMLGMLVANAQVFNVLPNDGSTSANGRAPSQRFSRIRAVYLIKASEIAASGLTASTTIEGIGWTYQASTGISFTAGLNVYLQNTNDATNLKGTTWGTAPGQTLDGMTLVHSNASTTLDGTTTPNVIFSGGSPFTYTGGSLYVAYDWGCYSGTLYAIVTMCNSLGLASPAIKSAQQQLACPGTPSSTLTLSSAFRPETRLIHGVANEAAVTHIYTEGKIPVGYSANDVIRARIVNNGTTAFTNLPCTLSVTGANTFSNVQTIASLAPFTTTVISFTGFSSTNTGTNSISVSIPSDANNSNNSVAMTQTVNTNLYSYNYPGGAIGGVVGVGGSGGNFVAKFIAANNYGNADTLDAIKVDFGNPNTIPPYSTFTSVPFSYGVWAADGAGGLPGTILYLSPSANTSPGQAFLPLPNIVVSGAFYVGIQETAGNVQFAYQIENPIRNNTFYYSLTATPNTWNDLIGSGAPFARFAIETEFYTPTPPNCVINTQPVAGANACSTSPTLSWASGGGSPTGYRITLGDNSPNYNNVANNVDLGLVTSYLASGLTQGNTYGWKVTAYNGVGDAIGCGFQTFTVVGSPAGNTQATAIVLTLPATVSGNNFSSNCFSDNYTAANTNGQASPDVFYKIHTGPCTDALTASLCGTAGTQDTYIHLLDQFGNEIASDDDGCGASFTSTINQATVSPNSDYYIVVEGFGTTQVSYSLSVTEFDLIPQVTAPNVTTVGPLCESGNLDLDAGTTPAGTYTYAWTTPDGYNPGNVSSFSESNITPSMSGLYSVTVTSAAGCVSNGSVSVTVNARPTTVPSASPAFCSGTQSLNLSSNAAGAATLTYAWTGPGGYSSTSPNPVIPTTPDITIPNPHTGSYHVVVTDGNGCTRSANVSATVYPIPDVQISLIGNSNLCTGQTTADLQATGAPDFVWSTTETTSLITVSTQGTYTVTGTDGNGCVNTNSQLITESAAPAAPIVTPAGPVVLCTDGFTTTSVNLSVTNYATGLLWSTSETDQSISVNYADIFNVTYTDGNGCYSVSNTVVTSVDNYSTNPTSASSNASFNNICLGNTVSLSVNGGSLGGNAQWVWYEGGCGSGSPVATGANPTITPASAGSHTYYVRAESVSCGNTSCASVTITVSPNTALSTVHYTASVSSGCNGGTGTLTVNAIAGAAFYNWSGTSGTLFNGLPGPVQTASNSVTVTFASAPPAGASGYSICCFAGNACANSNTVCTWVRSKISQPGVISGNPIGCPSSSQSYSIAPVTGADSYTWVVTGNATINGGSNTLTTASTSITVNFLGGWSSGTLSVYASLNCGFNSAVRALSISNTPGQPGTMSGPAYVCPSNSANFTVPAVTGANSYNWTCTVPGAVITPSGNSCSILFPAVIPAGSTVCVAAVSSCGNSSATRCKGISNGIPNTPSAISGPTTGQCGQLGVSYSILPVAQATGYIWTANNGATVSGPNNLSSVSINFPASFSTCTLTVVATNSCGISLSRTLVVNGAPALPGAIAGNQSVCNGATESYSTSGSVGATSYNWTAPAGATILNTPPYTNSILVLWGSTGGNVTVAAVNDCGSSLSRSLAVAVTCRQSQINETIETAASLYPNPTNGKTTLKFEASAAANYLINVVDVTGRIVVADAVAAQEGINMHELDLTKVSKGVYLVRIEHSGEQAQLLKVTVQ